jgi:hypothetical protein
VLRKRNDLQKDASLDPKDLQSENKVVKDCRAACEQMLSADQKSQGGSASCKAHAKSTYKGYVGRCCKNSQFCVYARARYDAKASECVLTY